LKIELTNIGSEYLQNYTLSKKVENRYIVEGLEAEIKIIDRAKYDYLLASTKRGDDRETGQIIVQCGNEDFEKDVFIKHNEGKFDLRNCIATKGPQLVNVLDCVADREINIFDYPQSSTNTLQGTIETFVYSESKLVVIEFNDDTLYNFNLNYLLSLMNPIPDKKQEGYFELYKAILVTGGTTQAGTFIITIQVLYIRNRSSIKHTNDWVQIPNETDYYLPFRDISWGAPEYDFFTDTVSGNKLYTYVRYIGGKYINYADITISNTYEINQIIEDVFTCTGLTVVSNFLNINADGSNPNNKYYEYAQNNCQNLKIVQSFDIIRENQLQDSFGQSGIISVKDLMSDLCLLFNLNIIPDVENEIIRIEHISYFTRKGIDLTDIDYEIGEVTINKDEIDSETFQMAQITPDADFYEAKITYDRKDIYKDLNEKTYKAKKFITDVFGTINNNDYNKPEYRPLFYLLSTDGDNIIGLNNAMSWRNLITLHDMHRPLKSGRLNGNLITFNEMSIGMDLEIKLYGSVRMWNKIWPYNSVKIKQGTFMIVESSYNEEGVLTLKTIK
jgi:hypothetical protein